ncbi:MAG: NADPH-dependent glutamate synthase, partial [Clostridia bacterium]|nr:NADPH-dependent glutamate synthase [Clostridia bacterium]
NDFFEVSLGLDAEAAQKEAARCLQCKRPLCVEGCPVGVKIPDFIRVLKEEGADGALSVIKSTNFLPAVCGRVCPQEKQCESRCVLNKTGAPVAIGLLERYVADHGSVTVQKTDEGRGKRVAVVGSGPASLTCAAELARRGFAVTVLEAFHAAGGVLVYGIPEFRLPKALVQQEIERLKQFGVDFELNTVVGKTVTVEQLLEEYHAVFLGCGAGLPKFLGVEGEGLNGVCSANEYLTRVNLMQAYKPKSVTPVQRGKSVAVIGAGNVAMDAARTALRMGAESVSVVYRRGRDEMPARAEEIHHAEEEGVRFCLLTNPVRFVGGERVEGVVCERMELGEPDASGRRRPVPIEGSEFTVPCDMAIVALGTVPNPMIARSTAGLAVSERGTLLVDEAMRTSVKGVYAGGDAVTGAATVILAMGAGKRAAQTIAEDLSSDDGK